jgi:1-phosphatidylinositol-3-phosphate 5-kinase
MNSELTNIKNDLHKITKEKYEDFNKKFNFPTIGTFEEEKLPTTELKVTIFYSKHFESLRILYCASYFEFLYSIIKSQEWSSVTGGKSKAHFFKSWDERFVVKCLSEMEFKMFIESCFHYFVHNNKYFFFKMPSSLVKVVGAYKIKIKSLKKNIIYCVIMENLNYLLKSKETELITYDLKGSSVNRYIKEKENGRVLMDTNFIEDFSGEPLALDQKIYTLFLCSISNDTKICRTMGVIDYSLLCVIVDYNDDENNNCNSNDKEENYNKIIFNQGDNEGKIKYIRLGVLDYFRKYTWDKQLETLGKTIMHKFTAPTVINPKKYDERFFKKLSSYFIGS